MKSGFHKDIGQLPEHSWMYPTSSHGILHVQFVLLNLPLLRMDQSSVLHTGPMHLTPDGQQKRQDGEDIEHLSMLHVSCHQIPCAIQKWADIFSSLPFVADTSHCSFLMLLARLNSN